MKQELDEFFSDVFLDGDPTVELENHHTVLDVGAFQGLWCEHLISKYPNLNVYLIEPLESAYKVLENKFHNHPNIQTKNVGVSIKEETVTVFDYGDSTSTLIRGGDSNDVTKLKLQRIEDILNEWNLDTVDFVQINIEGAEYDILDNWILSKTIKKFNTIQIQFHNPPIGPDDSDNRLLSIRNNLKGIGYTLDYCYDYVWERWSKE